MVRAGRAIASRIVAAVVIAMLIVVGLGVVSSGVLNSTSSTRGSSSVSTSVTTESSTSSNSSVTVSSSSGLNQTVGTSNSTLGLELLLSVNSTTIPSEDSIDIAISVLNLQSTRNNLTASDDWPVQGLASGVCGSVPPIVPAGMAVFRGYYGMNNVSSAKALQIWPDIACPATPELNVTSYSFLPKADVANYSGYPVSPSQSSPAKQESYTRVAFVTWIYAANDTGFFMSLGSALPSAYTLAAGDEWGQLVVLHFQVTASDNLPEVGNFLSFEPGCSPGPCIAQRFSQALIFNCAAAAATPAGCAATYDEGVRYSAAPPVNYTVTVWYPSYGQPNEPAGANCMYSSWPVGALGKPTTPPGFGYCLMVNSTAFVVSLPQS